MGADGYTPPSRPAACRVAGFSTLPASRPAGRLDAGPRTRILRGATLPEFLGLVGAVLLGIVAPIVALWMDYGFLVACIAFPVGFLAGWVLGVGAWLVLMRLRSRSAPELARGGPQATSDEET